MVRIPVNRVVWFLTCSDILLLSSFGLISPIFAVFVTGQVKGADLGAVGLASTIYLLLKSGLQVPLARVVDKVRGERDDFLAMLVGSIIISVVPLFYIFVKNVSQLFLVQAIYGIGGAFAYPPWVAIFTRHVDKKRTGWEWSVYATLTDFGGAITAGVGGFLAGRFGFRPLFLTVSLISFAGSFLLMAVRRDLRGGQGICEKI